MISYPNLAEPIREALKGPMSEISRELKAAHRYLGQEEPVSDSPRSVLRKGKIDPELEKILAERKGQREQHRNKRARMIAIAKPTAEAEEAGALTVDRGSPGKSVPSNGVDRGSPGKSAPSNGSERAAAGSKPGVARRNQVGGRFSEEAIAERKARREALKLSGKAKALENEPLEVAGKPGTTKGVAGRAQSSVESVAERKAQRELLKGKGKGRALAKASASKEELAEAEANALENNLDTRAEGKTQDAKGGRAINVEKIRKLQKHVIIKTGKPRLLARMLGRAAAGKAGTPFDKLLAKLTLVGLMGKPEENLDPKAQKQTDLEEALFLQKIGQEKATRALRFRELMEKKKREKETGNDK
jgi:hypothetical protein